MTKTVQKSIWEVGMVGVKRSRGFGVWVGGCVVVEVLGSRHGSGRGSRV